MSAVSPARRAAFAILKAIGEGRGHSDAMLRAKSVTALSTADRNLTTALALGVLRWQIDLDRSFRPFLKHPDAKLDSEVLIALRLGAFQLLRMDRIPVHAAIDESVELAKQAGHRFASGMVNAVLRRLADARGKPAENMSDDCCRDYPAWLGDRWKANYGEGTARAICRHGQTQPNLTVRISGDFVEEALAAEDIVLRPGELLTPARQVVAGDVTKTTAFRDGRIRIQDEGSQLIAELVPRGRAMLDCCAAPGGKTLIVAERNPDARIVACESSAQRLAQLRERLNLLEVAFNADSQTQPRLKMTLLSMWRSPMCPAAAPARWDETRRSGIGSAPKTCRGRPIGRRRFFAVLCVPSVLAAMRSIPRVLWSRRKTGR